MNHSLPQAPKFFSDSTSTNLDAFYNLIHSYMVIHVAQRSEYNGRKKRAGRPFTSDTMINPAGLNYVNGDPRLYFVENEPVISNFLATLTKVLKRQHPTKHDHQKLITSINAKADELTYLIDKSDRDNIDRLFDGIANWTVNEVQRKATIKAVVETNNMLTKLATQLKADIANLDK